MILRAPVVDIGEGRFVSKAIVKLTVEMENGADPATVTVSTGAETRTLQMKSAEKARFDLAVTQRTAVHA